MGYPKSKRCPDCQRNADRARDRQIKASGPVRRIGDTDICVICGKPYVICGGLQRYCPDCAPEAVRKRVNATKRAYAKSWSEQHTEYRKEMRNSGRKKEEKQ